MSVVPFPFSLSLIDTFLSGAAVGFSVVISVDMPAFLSGVYFF